MNASSSYTKEVTSNQYQEVTKHRLVVNGEVFGTIHEYATEVTFALPGGTFQKADSVEAAKREIDMNLLELAGEAA